MNGWHEVEAKLKAEIEDLQAEVASVKPLLDKLRLVEPDGVELRAVAATIHAFYNGIERIFIIIAKDVDNQLPQSTHWHRDLLDQMKGSTAKRVAVVDDKLHGRLIDYLGFRHFFRHSYPMRLNWKVMEELTKELSNTHHLFQDEINSFITELQNPEK